jgi:UDP-sugar pyrophosphorylase
LTSLTFDDGKSMTVNTEYNQIDDVLKAVTGSGDVADPATGLSPYPGNINQLLMEMKSYNKVGI